ncbi:hypothetical protein E4T42_01674 [Aureobasidium subglaciale]|nr:hypothetical protein E4T42_01674 [Aureobasidium subglaciale]
MSGRPVRELLPEGDFLEGTFWPRIVLGLPDKSDCITIQNEVMAAHAIRETPAREKDHAEVVDGMATLSAMLQRIADNSEIDLSDLTLPVKPKRKQAKPSASSDAFARVDVDLKQEMIALSKDYLKTGAMKGKKLYQQLPTKESERTAIINAWRDHLDKKMAEDYRVDWANFTRDMLVSAYRGIAKFFAEEIKASKITEIAAEAPLPISPTETRESVSPSAIRKVRTSTNNPPEPRSKIARTGASTAALSKERVGSDSDDEDMQQGFDGAQEAPVRGSLDGASEAGDDDDDINALLTGFDNHHITSPPGAATGDEMFDATKLYAGTGINRRLSGASYISRIGGRRTSAGTIYPTRGSSLFGINPATRAVGFVVDHSKQLKNEIVSRLESTPPPNKDYYR